MLNNKGIYYTKEILKNLREIRDKLSELKILKTSDLGEKPNLAAISSSISPDFISNGFPSMIVEGFSKIIKDDFYYMGQENLRNIPEAVKYYDELKKVYEDKSKSKGYKYYNLFLRNYNPVTKCLEENLLKAERKEGVAAKRKGSSYCFETTQDNIIPLTGIDDDYTKMGLRMPGTEGKYIQIDGNDFYRSKVNNASTTNRSNVNVTAIVNIAYNDEKEINQLIYPVVSTYKGTPIEFVEMIPASELINILMKDYAATSSNNIVDMEPFYEQAERISRQSLQPVVYFVTGKNKAYVVNDCQKSGEWPLCVMKAASLNDMQSVTLLTARGMGLALNRGKKNQLEKAKNAA